MDKSTKASFAVLYSWKLKPGFEAQFINSWSSVTQALLTHGSFGSRLHKGHDGIWYAYAQWPSSAARDAAFNEMGQSKDTAMMAEAILESFPPILMEPIADYLVLPAQT